MEDIEYYDIPIYNFPYDVEEDDEETIQDNSELRVSIALYKCVDISSDPDLFRLCFHSLSLDRKKK